MSTRTQCQQVIDYLATGKSLTPIQALRKFGCFRLGARIWDLKRDGHKIEAERVTKNGKTFAAYYLVH